MIEELYHQVIAGNKTQTRRTSGLGHINYETIYEEDQTGERHSFEILRPDRWELMRYNNVHAKFMRKVTATEAYAKPRYKVGEVLYIKEPISTGPLHRVFMYALPKAERASYKFKNKMFMPASAARAFIRITNIKCERLLEISKEDAIAEGIELRIHPNGTLLGGYKDYQANIKDTVVRIYEPKCSFLSLYKFANKLSDKVDIGNPWVWCYEFQYLPDYKL